MTDSNISGPQKSLARPFRDLLASPFRSILDLVLLMPGEPQGKDFLGFSLWQFRAAHFIFLRHTNSC